MLAFDVKNVKFAENLVIMLKEQTTTYAYKLKYLENPTFDRIRAFANTFINELPSELRDELYDSLNRGTDLLDSEPSMLVYLFSFGKMHQAKLNYAFSKIIQSTLKFLILEFVVYVWYIPRYLTES